MVGGERGHSTARLGAEKDTPFRGSDSNSLLLDPAPNDNEQVNFPPGFETNLTLNLV